MSEKRALGAEIFRERKYPFLGHLRKDEKVAALTLTSMLAMLCFGAGILNNGSPRQYCSSFNAASDVPLAEMRRTKGRPRLLQAQRYADPKDQGVMDRTPVTRGPFHSTTSLALASNEGGIARPSAFATVTLMINSCLVGKWKGMSLGFAPLKMRSISRAARRARLEISIPYDMRPPNSTNM